MSVKLISRKTSTFHDYPYSHPDRKCFHCWIVNVTPAGPRQCRHECVYCYAREAIYASRADDICVYDNLTELVERDLNRVWLCPPISISNVADPCQDIAELRGQVMRLVAMLMRRGVSFAITTKGDPSFLLGLDGFAAYESKLVAITIEGTDGMLSMLSPGAPPFAVRLAALKRLAGAGVKTVVRLDPVFPHLLQALYGVVWRQEMDRLVGQFSAAGAKHVVSSTGRLSRRTASGPGARRTSWYAVRDIIARHSAEAAGRFEKDYVYEAGWSGRGYRLRPDARVGFHRFVRGLVESRGMTYATCQELPSAAADSPGIPHCLGLPLPFAAKDNDGIFRPVVGCTSRCHVSCRGLAAPACGRPRLVTPEPLRLSWLVPGR